MNTETKHVCKRCNNEFQSHYGEINYCIECENIRENEYAYLKKWKEIIPPLYQQSDLERLSSLCPNAKKALEWQYGEKNLLLIGQSGTGKTRVAIEHLRKRHFPTSYNSESSGFYVDSIYIGILDCATIGMTLQKMYADFEAGDYLKKFMEIDTLLIDDFGKQKSTERLETDLYGIIDHRINWKKPTIITSNFNLEVLEKSFSTDKAEPFMRRIRENFEIIPMVKSK